MFFWAFLTKSAGFCRKSSYTFSWKSKTFLHFMFEIEKSLKSVGNFLHIQQNELFSSKSVGSMLPTVYTFCQKIIQLALLISYLRWTVLLL